MDLFGLTQELGTGGGSLRLRQATVWSIQSNGTITVLIGGSQVSVSGVKCLGHVCVKVGATVWLATDGVDLLAIGTVTPVGPAFCAVLRTSDITVADVTDTQVDFLAGATVEADTHGMFNTGAPSYLTCQVPGVYQITANIAWAAGATGLRSMWFLVNGTTTIAREARTASGTGTNTMSLSAMASLAVGDQLALWVRHSQGASLACQYGAFYPRLTCCWLRPVKS